MANAYVYNINNNSYKNNINLDINCPKLIFNANNHIYVICQMNVKKSSNLVDWTTYKLTKPKLPKNLALISCLIRKQDYIYFVDTSYNLRRFNLQSVQIENIKYLALR